MERSQFGQRMYLRRKQLGKTLDDIAKEVGVAVSTVQRYENNKIIRRKMPVSQAIARALGVTTSWLEGETDKIVQTDGLSETTQKIASFPVVTSVAAHFSGLSYESIDACEYIYLPIHSLRGRTPSEFFAIRVHGDSMYPEYQNDDVVLILRQSVLDYSGRVGVIIYGLEEMTLKRIEFDHTRRWLRLVPINPMIPAKMIEGEALESCHIIGVPWLLLRNYA